MIGQVLLMRFYLQEVLLMNEGRRAVFAYEWRPESRIFLWMKAGEPNLLMNESRTAEFAFEWSPESRTCLWIKAGEPNLLMNKGRRAEFA